MTMKRLLAVSASFLVAATTVQALPDYEPFADATGSGGTSYAPGSVLGGQINAQGFSWADVGTSTAGPYITNTVGNLDVPGLSPGLGNSILFGGLGKSARMGIGSSITAGTVYYSFAVNITNITGLSTSGIFWAGLNNSTGTQTGQPTVVGSKFYTRAVVGGFQFGFSKNSTATTDLVWDSVTHTVNETNFIVATYTFGGAANLWINPSSSTFGNNALEPSPTLTSPAGTDISAVASFLFAQRNAGQPAAIIADELHIGTTWADVTPTGPKIAVQPQSQRVLAGTTATFNITAVGAAGYQWRFNGTDIPGATGATLAIPNAQAGNVGSYRVVATNGPTAATSSVAQLFVVADIYPRLGSLWSIPPNTTAYPFVTVDASSAPNQRSIAYHALSNQVLVVSRTNFVTGSTNPMIHVLDASTGANLYTLDTSMVTEGAAGTPALSLVSIDVADDGAVYAANVSVSTSAVNKFRLYRWPDSANNQVGTLVYDGVPNGLDNTPRWGDTLRARGTGTGTEVIADSSDGNWFAVLTPTDSSMTAFTCTVHSNLYSGGSIGRSLQFGNANSYWEKRKAVGLQQSTYDTTAFSYVTVNTNFSNFPSTLGPVGLRLSAQSNWVCGIDFVSSGSTPDTLDLYEVSDLSTPLLLAKYGFPTNHQGNPNFIGQVLFGGTNVYAIDGNNGIAAFTWVPFRPALNIVQSGTDVLISWVTNATGYTLYSAPSVTPTITWSPAGAGTIVGTEYVVTNSVSGAPRVLPSAKVVAPFSLFSRLICQAQSGPESKAPAAGRLSGCDHVEWLRP